MATKLKIKTSEGDIVILLYDETPKHRDNFLKLAKEGYYNGTLFHRASSGSQFYIVWGKTYKPAELKQMERQMEMQQEQDIFNQLAKEHHEEIMNLRRNRDRAGLQTLQDKLIEETKTKCKQQGKPTFTPEQTEAYTTIGGTPFLDNQYTVFGEVEEGLDTVERIQNCATDRNDQPIKDVKIEAVDVL